MLICHNELHYSIGLNGNALWDFKQCIGLFRAKVQGLDFFSVMNTSVLCFSSLTMKTLGTELVNPNLLICGRTELKTGIFMKMKINEKIIFCPIRFGTI